MNFRLQIRGKFWNRLSIKEVHFRQYFALAFCLCIRLIFYNFPIELKQCWMPVTNVLYCCPKGVVHLPKNIICLIYIRKCKTILSNCPIQLNIATESLSPCTVSCFDHNLCQFQCNIFQVLKLPIGASTKVCSIFVSYFIHMRLNVNGSIFL